MKIKDQKRNVDLFQVEELEERLEFSPWGSSSGGSDGDPPWLCQDDQGQPIECPYDGSGGP